MPSLGLFLFSGWVLSGVSFIWMCDGPCSCGKGDCCGKNSWRDSIREAAEQTGVSGWRLWLAATLVLLFIMVASPFIWAWTFWEVARQNSAARRELRWLKDNHQEYLFAWQRVDELPKEVRRLFDAHSDRIEPLGFECVGNYRMKELPEGYFGRLFLSEDGTTISSQIDMASWEHTPGPSFTTLLADGRVVETALVDPYPDAELFDGHKGFTGILLGTEIECEAAHRRHQEAVRDLCERHQTEPLQLAREQVTDALRYEGRLFSQILHEHGRYKQPPPAPELPPAIALEG